MGCLGPEPSAIPTSWYPIRDPKSGRPSGHLCLDSFRVLLIVLGVLPAFSPGKPRPFLEKDGKVLAGSNRSADSENDVSLLDFTPLTDPAGSYKGKVGFPKQDSPTWKQMNALSASLAKPPRTPRNVKERHQPGSPQPSPHLMPLRHRMVPLTCRLNSFFAISAPLREGVL